MNILLILLTSLLGLFGGLGTSLILITLNEILTNSGTRAPNEFDMLIIFSFPILAVAGTAYGYTLGKNIVLLGQGFGGILHTPHMYYVLSLAILAAVGTIIWFIS